MSDLARRSSIICSYALRVLANVALVPEHLRALLPPNSLEIGMKAATVHGEDPAAAAAILRYFVAISYSEDVQIALGNAGVIADVIQFLKAHNDV